MNEDEDGDVDWDEKLDEEETDDGVKMCNASFLFDVSMFFVCLLDTQVVVAVVIVVVVVVEGKLFNNMFMFSCCFQ